MPATELPEDRDGDPEGYINVSLSSWSRRLLI